MAAAMKSGMVIRVLLATLLPASAWAHAILVDSTPAAGSAVPAGQEAMTLRFNSKIDSGRSRLTLVAPDASLTRLPITAGSTADVMTSTADLKPGDYTVRWQVLAIDGHITRGDVPFTVKAH